jgi:hypothetical protein
MEVRDTRKLYYLTFGEPFTETNSKNTLKYERYRNFISNSFGMPFSSGIMPYIDKI